VIYTVTAPANVATGIRTRLQHIRTLEREIALIVSIIGETNCITGDVALKAIEGNDLTLEVKDE
jgi:hypothetical protein